jgi:hypothetical protein
MHDWMQAVPAAARRLRWLFAFALAATVLQALGWDHTGRAMAAVWRGVWPFLRALWPLLTVAAASLVLAAWPPGRRAELPATGLPRSCAPAKASVRP